MSRFYVTTTLPYVNAKPHIGFALEIIQADSIARYHRILGDDVVFNFGTDEHGLKIYQEALKAGKTPQEYCDEYSKKFDALKKALNLSYSHFIRTTDKHHILAAQEFWKICKANGDIYKKNYRIKYCIGCELEKTDSELVDGKCSLHPKLDIQIYEEENYFFRFSRYQKKLQELYSNRPEFVIPTSKFNEIKSFVEQGIQDFSISRLKAKMPWGIDAPDDPDHVIYVWFDALINYISTIGWPDNLKEFHSYWPVIQFAGKDQIRQQAAMWQSMLMSANLPPSKQIFIHGFLTVDGQKISKSLGNTIDPVKEAENYGTDAIRYYLLAKIHPSEDSDFSWDKFKETYNADLANGLGNLVARIAKLCENKKINGKTISANNKKRKEQIFNLSIFSEDLEKTYREKIENYKFNEALQLIWDQIKIFDQEINEKKPWVEKLDENGKDLTEIFLKEQAIFTLRDIAHLISPFMPQTSQKILSMFDKEKIVLEEPLFPRLDKTKK